MTRLTVHGFYGMGNLGDEAILVALLGELGRYPGVEVTVLSRNPDGVRSYHGIDSISSNGLLSGYSVGREISKSDLFMLGGGGLLKDYGGSADSLIGWLRYLRRAQDIGVRSATYAIGAENIRFEESKVELRSVLREVDMVTVRDAPSADVLSSLGIDREIEVTSDPAVLLGRPGAWKEAVRRDRKVAVCVRHWYSRGNEIEDEDANTRFIESMATVVDRLIDEGYGIDLIPMRTDAPDDDRVVADRIVDLISSRRGVRVVGSAPRVETFVRTLPRYELLIGMRLHSLILASSVGLPIVGLEYMPKVGAYMNSIGEGERSLALEDITPEGLMEAVYGALDDPVARSEAMAGKVEGLRELARRNVAMMMKLARAGKVVA